MVYSQPKVVMGWLANTTMLCEVDIYNSLSS